MKGIKNKTIGVFQHHTNATKRTTPCGLRYSCIILVGPCSRLKCAKLFFFFFSSGCLFASWSLSFVMDWLFLWCWTQRWVLWFALLVVFGSVGAVWNVVAYSWFLRTTRVNFICCTKIDCDPGETIVNQDIEHRIQRQQRWYGTTTNSCSFVFILRSGRHSVVWVTQKIHYICFQQKCFF